MVTSMSCAAAPLIRRLSSSRDMTRRHRSRSLTLTMPHLRDIAVDSSLVMLAFLNTDNQRRRLRFGDPLKQTFKDDTIPTPLLDLLRYMNDEGVDIPDVFRRPGNTTEQKKLIKKLTDGKPVKFSDYNFYTLASVIKRFLLCIPGGILGEDLEIKALTVLYIEDTIQQLQTLRHIIACLALSVQHLLALLFGLWYRIAQREHIHQMSAEAMAKSVTGSIFVNTTGDPRLVKNAAKVMELMIENFTCPHLFGEDNLQFFADVTLHTDLNNDLCAPDHNTTNQLQDGNKLSPAEDCNHRDKPTTLPHIDEIKSRQLDRLKQRTDWFLSSANIPPNTARRNHRARSYKTQQTIDVITCPQNDTESDTSIDTVEDNT